MWLILLWTLYCIWNIYGVYLSKISEAEDSVFTSCWLTGSGSNLCAIHTIPVFVSTAVLQDVMGSRLFVNCAFDSYVYTSYFYTWSLGCTCGEMWLEVAGQWLQLHCVRKGGRMTFIHQIFSVSGLDQFNCTFPWEMSRPNDAKSICPSFVCMHSVDILNEAYEDNYVAREWGLDVALAATN
jgi:hypothetical protein